MFNWSPEGAILKRYERAIVAKFFSWNVWWSGSAEGFEADVLGSMPSWGKCFILVCMNVVCLWECQDKHEKKDWSIFVQFCDCMAWKMKVWKMHVYYFFALKNVLVWFWRMKNVIIKMTGAFFSAVMGFLNVRYKIRKKKNAVFNDSFW